MWKCQECLSENPDEQNPCLKCGKPKPEIQPDPAIPAASENKVAGDIPYDVIPDTIRCYVCHERFTPVGAFICLNCKHLVCEMHFIKEKKVCTTCRLTKKDIEEIVEARIKMMTEMRGEFDQIQSISNVIVQKKACAVCGDAIESGNESECNQCGNVVCKKHFDIEKQLCVTCSRIDKFSWAFKCSKCGVYSKKTNGFKCAKCEKYFCEKDINIERRLCKDCESNEVKPVSLSTEDHLKELEILKKAFEKGEIAEEFDWRFCPYAAHDGVIGVWESNLKSCTFNTHSQNCIGNLYYKGIGVERDYTKALEWYKRAAEQGYPAAQSNIGHMYKNGCGVDQDYQKSLQWHLKAADQGFAYSQHEIGVFYRDGLGVEKDLATAEDWFKKAIQNGYEDIKSGIRYCGNCGNERNESDAICSKCGQLFNG